MKQWGKGWFYRITFFTAILMLIAGVFYLFRKLILAGSGQYVSYDVTQEGETAFDAGTKDSGETSSQPETDASGYTPTGYGSDASLPSAAGTAQDPPGLVDPPDPSDSSQPTDVPSPVDVSEPAPLSQDPTDGGPFSEPRVLDPEKPIVALTFDDGPGQGTGAILDLLEQYDARATFFVIGLCLEQPVQVAKLQRAYQLGCVIGSHTYDHISFKKLDAEQIQSQTDRVNELLMQYIGTPVSLVRPPYGHITDEARDAAATPYIHWSIDTEDWLSRDAQSVIAMVQENIQDGDIILMHDIYPSTAEACETLIPWLIEQGYQLATVPEMMQARGIAMENGQMYKNAR